MRASEQLLTSNFNPWLRMFLRPSLNHWLLVALSGPLPPILLASKHFHRKSLFLTCVILHSAPQTNIQVKFFIYAYFKQWQVSTQHFHSPSSSVGTSDGHCKHNSTSTNANPQPLFHNFHKCKSTMFATTFSSANANANANHVWIRWFIHTTQYRNIRFHQQCIQHLVKYWSLKLC